MPSLRLTAVNVHTSDNTRVLECYFSIYVAIVIVLVKSSYFVSLYVAYPCIHTFGFSVLFESLVWFLLNLFKSNTLPSIKICTGTTFQWRICACISSADAVLTEAQPRHEPISKEDICNGCISS